LFLFFPSLFLSGFIFFLWFVNFLRSKKVQIMDWEKKEIENVSRWMRVKKGVEIKNSWKILNIIWWFKLIFRLLEWCMLSILALIVTSLSTVRIHVHDWDLPVLWTPVEQ
jgi:hypothetical protein